MKRKEGEPPLPTPAARGDTVAVHQSPQETGSSPRQLRPAAWTSPIGPGGSGRSLPLASAAARTRHVTYGGESRGGFRPLFRHLTFPLTAALQQYELISANELQPRSPAPLALVCVCVCDDAIPHTSLAASLGSGEQGEGEGE